MSIYHFKTNIERAGGLNRIETRLGELQHSKEIERWHISHGPENLLEIETNKLTPEEVKHLIREAGFEADFTTAPQARNKS